MTDEEKRKIQLERTSLADEYGNDFDSIQKYCIEKIIKRNLNIKSTIIGKLLRLIPMTKMDIVEIFNLKLTDSDSEVIAKFKTADYKGVSKWAKSKRPMSN